MSRKRVLVLIGAVLLVLLALSKLAAWFTPGQAQANAKPPATASSDNPSAATQPDDSTASSEPTKAEAQLADAATTAVSVLSSAVFLPDDQMKQVVNQLVAPDSRKAMLGALQQTGTAMATKVMSYTDLASAVQASGYYVEVPKYRIVSNDSAVAQVAVYSVSNWADANGNHYQVPAISIIQMVKTGGHWYYAGTTQPPANQVPNPSGDLSFDQTVELYRPYLKEFKDVSDIARADNP